MSRLVDFRAGFYNWIMAKMLAFMITWTTYGTWLQGDERQYVKKGKTLPANDSLAKSNKESLAKAPVKLSKTQRKIVAEAILAKAERYSHKILALAVCSDHIHVLVGYTPFSIGRIVAHYKNAAQAALRECGISGRVWTKGFDKRYCYDDESIERRIAYVNAHNDA